jgi:hypothetical protein
MMREKVLWEESGKPPADGRWYSFQTVKLKIQCGDTTYFREVREDTYYQYVIKDEMMNKYNVPEKLIEELLDRAYAEGSKDEAEANAGEDI